MTSDRKILIVEDDRDVLEAEIQIFQYASSLCLQSAECVDSALEKLESHAFDLIISDFNLGDRTGLEIYERASKIGVPFIFYSGQSRLIPELKWPFIAAIDKPDFSGLVRTVEKQLGVKIAA